jgi:hypothetical protein
MSLAREIGIPCPSRTSRLVTLWALFALSVAVPLLAAAGILAARPLLGKTRRVLDLVAVLTTCSICSSGSS